MTTTLQLMHGGPNAPADGMASRAAAGPLPAYGACTAGAVSPASAPSTGVAAAWRKTTAAGTCTTHHTDAVFATISDGSGGSG